MKITKYTLFTLIFGLFLSVFPLQAVIVEGERGTLGNKTITFLSDRHFDDLQEENGPNWQQKNDLFGSIKDPKNTLLITEDICDCSSIENWIPGEQRETLKTFTESKRSQDFTTAFLVGTTDSAYKLGIEVYNAEFRQLMVCGIASEPSIRISDINNIYGEITKEIQGYRSDLPFVTEFYQQTIKEYNTCNSLQRVEEKDKRRPIKNFYDSVNHRPNKSEQEKEYAKNIFLYDSNPLLDARILNKILTTDKKHVIVCAGKIHIDILKAVLNRIGYQQTSARHGSLSDPLPETMRRAQWLGYKLLGYKYVINNNEQYDTRFVQPINIKELLAKKPSMPRWFKIGLGIAAGTAITYTLYKRFFKS